MAKDDVRDGAGPCAASCGDLTSIAGGLVEPEVVATAPELTGSVSFRSLKEDLFDDGSGFVAGCTVSDASCLTSDDAARDLLEGV